MPTKPVKRALSILALTILIGACAMAAAREEPAVDDAPIALSAQERAWLDDHRDLRLGLWLGPPPVIFRGDDGHIRGLVPTYVDLILSKLRIKPRRVRASGLPAANGLARAREVDMVAALPAGRDNAETMVLSDPFAFLPVAVATRANFRIIGGLDDLAGETVAVNRDSVSPDRLGKDHPGLRLLVVDDAAEGVRALAEGRVAAYVGVRPSIAFLAERLGKENIRVAAITEYPCTLAVGVRRDWPVLLTLINRALASISPEEHLAIENYWTVLRRGRWMELSRVRRLAAAAALGALLIFGALLFRNRSLSRELARSRRGEAALRRAHEATRRIIESAHVVIVGLDYNGRVRLINHAGEKLTGYRREELIGRDWFELATPRERYLFVWDEFNRLLRERPKCRAEPFESPLVTRTGEIRRMLWRSSVMEPGGDEEPAVIAFGTDITPRLRDEEELRLNQFAVDNAAVGILRVRPSGRIVYANRTASSLLGLPRDEIGGRTLAELGPFPAMEPWPDFWERLTRTRVLIMEAEAAVGRGENLPVELRIHHLSFKGAELAICFLADIAERKRVEQLRADVERMMRHDLRSPTIAVQSMLMMLARRGELSPKQRELLDIARSAGERMLGIIDLSRALFRMEEGVYEATPESVDIPPLVAAVLDELSPLMRSRRVTLAVNIEGRPAGPRSAFVVRSEKLLCYALLANLLKNAVEASPEGGEVTLDLAAVEGVHVLEIHNMGAIPPSIRDVFFEKYVTAGKKEGTGLGAYTSRLIATSLGGSIDFATSEETGTTLTVRLPDLPDTHS